jgi:hypothetical protein
MNRKGPMVERPGMRHLKRAVLVLMMIPFAAILAGAGIQRWYWGYWWERPALSPLVAQSSQVRSLTSLYENYSSGVFAGWTIGPVTDPEHVLREARKWPEAKYYWLKERVLESLVTRALVQGTAPALSSPAAASLRDQFIKGPWLAQPHRGYKADWEDGLIVELTDQSGRRVVAFAVRQGEVSNDHRAYTEAVFEQESDGSMGRLLDYRQFYFDVAGLEGANLIGFILLSAVPLVAVGVSISAAFLVLMIRDMRRCARGCCSRCGYALSGLMGDSPEVICPECGFFVPRRGIAGVAALSK